MTAETIARELGGRRSGAGYLAPCPSHDDGKPSLSLCDAAGKVLVHCHAGCTQADVIEALKNRGLWEPAERYAVNQERIEAEYTYTDERGEMLYQIVRKTGKKFLQRYPDGRGEWIWKKHPRQVLYHLQEVIEAPIVFLTEGEKDAETLRSYGFVATTNAGGAKAAWLDSYIATLAGKEVIIIPDNDTPGWQRAKTITRALLGSAARIRIFDLPLGTKDISDWFAAGHSECELIAMLEGVNAV